MLVSHRQVTASEVNAAILGGNGRGMEDAVPRISVLLKMIIWAQKQVRENNAQKSIFQRSNMYLKQRFK